MKALAIILLGLTICFVGCTAIKPLSSMVNEEFITNPSGYQVIGDVQGESSRAILFGFIPVTTNAGYLAAYQDAMATAHDQGADGLIEIFSDQKVTNVLGLYVEYKTIVYAKAIKRK